MHVLILLQYINPGAIAIIMLSKENQKLQWQKQPENLLHAPTRFFKESLTFISFFLNIFFHTQNGIWLFKLYWPEWNLKLREEKAAQLMPSHLKSAANTISVMLLSAH